MMGQKLGFRVSEENTVNVREDKKLNSKIERSGVEAARRKFTPEFMNRLDKIVVFRPLGDAELRRILDLELAAVQERIFQAPVDRSFVFSTTEAARNHLLEQGTDVKYGARHLKRAIERLVVQPISNLMATDQVRSGDLIKVDYDGNRMVFLKEAENMNAKMLAELGAAVGATYYEPARIPARSGRR